MDEGKRTSRTRAESHPEDPDEADRRARFARALTRSVFGRHYWDRRLEQELRRANRRKRRR